MLKRLCIFIFKQEKNSIFQDWNLYLGFYKNQGFKIFK